LLCVYVLLLIVACIIFATPAHATIDPTPVKVETPAEIQDYIVYMASIRGVDVSTALAIAKCESNFNGKAVGDHGTSFGTYQIHLPAHPNITKAQALNPTFAINWSINQMALGKFSQWSCFKLT
jgi:hypothetical protein